MPASEQEIDDLVMRWAQTGARGPELIAKVSGSLQCTPSIVRRFVQNRYPGLMAVPRKERPPAPEPPVRGSGGRQKFRTSHNDVYRLPSRKRQGGHTF